MTTPQFHLRKIRKALKRGFDDVEFSSFCFDCFPRVHDSFAGGMRPDEKMTWLLDHCRRVEGGFETLLEAAREEYKENQALKGLVEALEAYLEPAEEDEQAVEVEDEGEEEYEEDKRNHDFIYRGPLAAESPLFRGRQAELAQLAQLCRGEVRAYAIVYGGRQMGKTSLLLHLPHKVPWAHHCRIDFQAIPRASTGEVYAYIAQRVARSLAVKAKEVNNSTTLVDFLSDAVKGLGRRRLVLSLEELGALEQATRQELANVLRYIFTNRSTRSLRPLNRLMIIIAGSLELYELATIEVSPLHNICEPVYLPDLSQAEAVGLVVDGLAPLALPQTTTEAIGEAIYAQVSGYPYLTQRLGATLASKAAKGEPLTAAEVNQAAQSLLRDDPLLRHLRRALREHDLLPACKELLDCQLPFSRTDEEMSQLELLGLAKEVNSHWQVRNQLFASAIRYWLAEKD